jgi:hypothetical protein
MGNDNHVVVSHKFCGFQGCVGRHVVVMKEPLVVTMKFCSFLSHIFSQASQNITVNVRIDCSAKRNKFTVNNPLHVGGGAMIMPFVELWTCGTFLLLVIVGSSTATIVALFLDHNHMSKSNFCHSL